MNPHLQAFEMVNYKKYGQGSPIFHHPDPYQHSTGGNQGRQVQLQHYNHKHHHNSPVLHTTPVLHTIHPLEPLRLRCPEEHRDTVEKAQQQPGFGCGPHRILVHTRPQQVPHTCHGWGSCTVRHTYQPRQLDVTVKGSGGGKKEKCQKIFRLWAGGERAVGHRLAHPCCHHRRVPACQRASPLMVHSSSFLTSPSPAALLDS